MAAKPKPAARKAPRARKVAPAIVLDRAERVIQFIETLRLPDGTKAGQPFILRDWQKEIIREVYSGDGERVTQALLTMARKNGKTALVAALCLAHLCGPEAILNGQLYSVAFDRSQAAIIFKYMSAMIRLDAELTAELNIIDSRKTIVHEKSGSVYQALSAESKTKHGFSSSFIVFDELAQFGASRELYDVMMTSTGAHDGNALVWVISTQAADDAALMSKLVDDGRKINDGTIDDPTFKAFIYEIPPDADIFDEENWKAANPGLGDFRSVAEMRNQAEKAKRMPGNQPAFRNLYCNQRIDAGEHLISRVAWEACGGEVDQAIFETAEVFLGLDLSQKNDLTALVATAEDDEGVIHVKPTFWTPKDGIRERSEQQAVPYAQWADEGFLEAKDGPTIDYGWVARKIGEMAAEWNIKALAFDRWRIEDMKRELDDLGVDCFIAESMEDEGVGIRMLKHGQGFKDMSPSVELLLDMIATKRLRHGGHPVLTAHAAAVKAKPDPTGGRKFDKIKSTGKIDGIVALAQALRVMDIDRDVTVERSIYDADRYAKEFGPAGGVAEDARIDWSPDVLGDIAHPEFAAHKARFERWQDLRGDD